MPAPLRLRLDQRTREAVAERYERACAPIERTNAPHRSQAPKRLSARVADKTIAIVLSREHPSSP
jgi:hypothetical protein